MMDGWRDLKLILSAIKVELEDEEEIKTEDLRVDIKLTTGESGTLNIDSIPQFLEIRNGYGVLRWTLNTKDDLFLGSVSFDVKVFSTLLGKETSHWVSLKASAYNDDFTGTIGQDEDQKPRILLNFKVEDLPDTPSPENFDRDYTVVTNEEGADNSSMPVGGLIPGKVYTKGNLKVSLERVRVDPSKRRGMKSKEEVVAVLSEVQPNELEKHMELKTAELIEEVNMEKQKLENEEEILVNKLQRIEQNQGDLAKDEVDLK